MEDLSLDSYEKDGGWVRGSGFLMSDHGSVRDAEGLILDSRNGIFDVKVLTSVGLGFSILTKGRVKRVGRRSVRFFRMLTAWRTSWVD